MGSTSVKQELRLLVHRQERVLIASAQVLNRGVLLFAAHKAPDFVKLNVADRQIHELAIQKGFALLAGQLQDVQNRLLVNVRQPGNSSDADAFAEHVRDHLALFLGHAQIVQGPLWNVREGFAALFAPMALVSLPAESEPLHFNFAVVTCHLTFPGRSLQ